MSSTTVLFDLGNVLVRLNLERGLAHFRKLSERPLPSLEQSLLFFSDAALAFNRGELDSEGFLEELRRQLSLSASPEAIQAAWCDIFDPWPEMESLAERVLGAGHPAFLLSNTDPLHFRFLSARMPVLGRLTGLHLSYDARVMKPDPAYFRAAIERLSLAPERCAFVDDRPDNVEAARSVGIPSCVHTGDVRAVESFLRERGVAV